MRLSNNLDIYIRSNIQLNNVHKYNNTSNPFFTGIFDKENPDKLDKKTKYTLASVGGAILGALGIKKLAKTTPKVTPSEVKPVVETAVDVVGNLIKKLKPKNEELAREIFPILERNTEVLKVKPEEYNIILSGINKSNRKYMKEEGLNLISSQMEKMEDLIATPSNDVLTLVNHLTKDNQEIFTRIINDRDTFKLVDIDDVIMYLKHITPENKDYILNELAPLLEQYAQKLKVKTADKHARLLSHITPETQDIIPVIAESKALENQRISKYQLLLNVNKDNKDCVSPLLDNIETMGLKQDETINLLSVINNSQTEIIGSVGKNIATVNELGLDLNSLFSVLKDDKSAKIFDTVIANPQGYKIQELIDLKNYLKNLDQNNLEFADKELLPKLSEYAEVLGIQYAEEIAEIMGKITPKTIGSVDTVAKYAKDLGDGVSYTTLLQAVTEENQANLPRVMENIQNTDVWENLMVSADDFAKLLNSKG